MLVFKSVKPSRLKIDAFRLEFLTAIHKAERGILKDFEATTETWEHQPVFDTQISLKGGPTVLVGTDDEIYRLVSIDTGLYATGQRYPIFPKEEGGKLRFYDEYTPKTAPGVIGSVEGGDSGTIVTRSMVMHPGHEGRHFDSLIQEKWRPKFKRMMEDAMRKAVSKSGHKI